MDEQSSSGYPGLSLLRIGLAACGLLCVAACTSAAPGPTELPTAVTERDAETTLRHQIDVAIGDAPCNSDTQCRTIGLGANACGGPAAWRPWSTQNNGEGKSLRALTDRLSELQRNRQSHDGVASTCRYLPDPGAWCQAQRCALKTTANSAS